MALTFQQKRKLSIAFGVVLALVVVAVTMGKSIVNSVVGPDGYARRVPAGDYTRLNWETLMSVAVTPNEKATFPTSISSMNGRLASVRGYLLPLHAGTESSQFFLAPKPGNCYFCAPPMASEIIQVNIAGGKKVPMTNDVVFAYGQFQATDGIGSALYILNDAVLSVRE